MIVQASFFTAALLFAIGLYAIVFKSNLVKKVIGVTFITDAVNLTLVTMGYRKDGIVPIIGEKMTLENFASSAAYPLPQALVLTNIVIGVATTALILGVCIKLYNHYKTLDCGGIWNDSK